MKNSKKVVTSIIASALAAINVFGLAACGTKPSGGTGEIVAYDGSKVTVKFYHTMGADLKAVLLRHIGEFNKLFPNITIEETMAGDYKACRDQIATEITAKRQPSMAYCYPDHVALYNKAKAVLPLDEFINNTDTVTDSKGNTQTMGFTQAQIDDFIEVYYEEGRSFGDGKMYTLPFTKSTEVLYYNKTFFEEHNLDIPDETWTWEKMGEICAQIKQIDENCIPLGYDSEANWFITMTEQLKSGYTSATGEHFLFNTEKNREFVQMFREWFKAGYVTTEEIYKGYTSDLFKETGTNDDGSPKQKSYMCIGSSGGAKYQTPDPITRPVLDSNGQPVIENGAPVVETVYPFEVGITLIPQADQNNKKVIQQGPSVCLFKKSNSQEMAAAWLFTKYLVTSLDFQAEFSMTNGYTPVIKSVQQHPIYQQFLAKADGNLNLRASSVIQTLEQKDYYYISPAFNGSSEARDQVGILLQNCFLKNPSANQTVEQFIEAQFKATINTLKNDLGL